MKISAGQSVEIIYEDKSGTITQRRIAVRAVQEGTIRATDLASNQPRTFKADSILAWSPIKRTSKEITA